ncbi:UNVERIFIED_CONTAM: hypothetical protein RMT77_011433 [Armadillidium vulgare]
MYSSIVPRVFILSLSILLYKISRTNTERVHSQKSDASTQPYSLQWVREGRTIGPLQFSEGGETGRRILSEVTLYGLNQTKFMKEIQEPQFFKKGLKLPSGHPGLYLAAFNKQKQRTKDLAKFGYASLWASEMLSKQFLLTRTQATFGLEQVDLARTALYESCPFKTEEKLKPSCPAYSVMYRTLDGTCNNLEQPEWGSAFRPFSRFLPPDYNDGIESIRLNSEGDLLPNARRISSVVHRSLNNPSSFITQMVMQWGQFLDHDLTSTAQPRGFNDSVPKCCNEETGRPVEDHEMHPDCFPILIPKEDSFYSQWNHTCMEFLRSSPAPRPNCALGPRDQINQVTSFIDGSNVYGSDDHEMAKLRLWEDGMLKYKPMRFRKPLLPPLHHVKEGECREDSRNLHCFLAGDQRVNEHPGLASMHTLWLREHNRISIGLAAVNAHWNDDRLFFEARKIVGAEMQKITYGEWLPVVLGSAVMKIFRLPLQRQGYYKGYKTSVNPTATNSFGTAAFRFGHSLVQNNLARADKNGKKVPYTIRLHAELMNPANIHNFGSVDRLLLGMIFDNAQKRDIFITGELTRHLFQSPEHHYGLDLASINIQRGRDHGLPPYNIWREQCGLHRFKNWGELLQVIDDDIVGRLAVVYKTVDDIDVFTGGLAERPVVRGLVGPTFACILGQQFLNLRQGDRFWFENGGMVSSFKLEQLQEIRKVSLARVLCDNLDDIDEIHPNVMRPLSQEGRNQKISCDDPLLPKLNFSIWKEEVDENSQGLQYSGGDFNFNFSLPSSDGVHYTGQSVQEEEEEEDEVPLGLSEEEMFFLENEDDLQDLDEHIYYSMELPTPFQFPEEKIAKGGPRSDGFEKKAAPSWFSRVRADDVTHHNFNSVIEKAYTDTLFYGKKK